MDQKFRAVYQSGAFVLQDPCPLAEGTGVSLIVEAASPPQLEIQDRQERQEILNRLTDRMRANPIPPSACRLSRDDLHARR